MTCKLSILPEKKSVYHSFYNEAAAFSSAFIYFRALWEISHNEEDFIYAETLLNHSKQLHAAAISILPYKRYQKSIDAKGHSYSSSGSCLLNIKLSTRGTFSL